MLIAFALARQARPAPLFTSVLRQCHIPRPRAVVRLVPKNSNASRLFSTGRVQVQPVAKREPTYARYTVAGMGITLGLSLWAGNAANKIHCDGKPFLSSVRGRY